MFWTRFNQKFWRMTQSLFFIRCGHLAGQGQSQMCISPKFVILTELTYAGCPVLHTFQCAVLSSDAWCTGQIVPENGIPQPLRLLVGGYYKKQPKLLCFCIQEAHCFLDFVLVEERSKYAPHRKRKRWSLDLQWTEKCSKWLPRAVIYAEGGPSSPSGQNSQATELGMQPLMFSRMLAPSGSWTQL